MLSSENKRNIKVEIFLSISDEDIGDIMSSALCGGISYWSCLDNTKQEWKEYNDKEEYDDLGTDEIATMILLDGKPLYIVDTYDDTTLSLTLEKLLNGIRWAIVENSTLIVDGELDTCSIDASVADSIVQYAIFGEIVYG